MARFMIGDKVKIRLDADTQFRGRIGVVEKLPNEYANVRGYIIRIESPGFSPTCHILEKDLEAVNNKYK